LCAWIEIIPRRDLTKITKVQRSQRRKKRRKKKGREDHHAVFAYDAEKYEER